MRTISGRLEMVLALACTLPLVTSDLPKSPGHPFYKQLNRLLAEAGFDAWLENLCAPYYATTGRDSIPPRASLLRMTRP